VKGKDIYRKLSFFFLKGCISSYLMLCNFLETVGGEFQKARNVILIKLSII
jgi:hypothetical protein